MLAEELSVLNTTGGYSTRTRVTAPGIVSKELVVINERLAVLEERLQYRLMPVLSSDYANYDTLYGVNVKKVSQDFDKNNYIYKEPSTY
jgi:hypothetical protein